ncbi:MAG: hypothetical protein HY300_09195 [Verrucomicrobia bacterium]|nr:hypothetical protein [Verrucomicrobiota bacterium]
MRLISPQRQLGRLAALLVALPPDPERQAERIRFLERDVVLTIKVALLGLLTYVLYSPEWFEGLNDIGELALETMRGLFIGYLVLNFLAAGLLLFMHRLSFELVQWSVFVMNLFDGIFLALLAMVTGGAVSTIYWVFVFLILRNAISVPPARHQLALNSLATACFVAAAVLEKVIATMDPETLDVRDALVAALQRTFLEPPVEPFLMRIVFLAVLAGCGYALHVSVDRRHQAEEEARELATRQEQLHSTGRLAAEIAHQLKNPLGIINNAAFNLQRALKDANSGAAEQLDIIREEVARSDHIITELMGYAQLTEGRVEKLVITEELDRAIARVFPPGSSYTVKVEREYATGLPTLLMQRTHLQEVFVNVLLNAREALNGGGRVEVRAQPGENRSVIITIRDNGPGIAAYQLDQVFEPYFSTKEKGTGLGLAIVKHNTELYGGNVRAESELGKGAAFILQFPSKATMHLPA